MYPVAECPVLLTFAQALAKREMMIVAWAHACEHAGSFD